MVMIGESFDKNAPSSTEEDKPRQLRIGENPRFWEALNLLELTEKNQNLAEQYLDVSKPEEPAVLEQVERQDFYKLSGKTHRLIYDNISSVQKSDPNLAGRYVRFVMAIGGATCQEFLSYYGWVGDFEYLGEVLSPIQKHVLYANLVAWNAEKFTLQKFQPLIDIGMKDITVFEEMTKLCYSEESYNTDMLLAALYLHCVKPQDDAKSILCVPVEQDTRIVENPQRMKEMIGFLERCLINNIGGLFLGSSVPSEEDQERLKSFVRDSDPREPIPPEIWKILSGRQKHGYRTRFLPCLAFLAIEHSNRFVSMLRLAVALDIQTNTMTIKPSSMIQNTLDVCHASGIAWFDRHIQMLCDVLPVSNTDMIQWGIVRKKSKLLKQIAARDPEETCEILETLPADAYGYLVSCIKAGNPDIYNEMKETFSSNYHRLATEDASQIYVDNRQEVLNYLSGEIEIEQILPYVDEWRKEYRYGTVQKQSYIEYGEVQLYRRIMVLECLGRRDYCFKNYWADTTLQLTEKIQRNEVFPNVRQIEAILKLCEEERVPRRYQIEFFGSTYDAHYENRACESGSSSQQCVNVLATSCKEWREEWIEASRSNDLPTRVLAIRVMGEQWQEYRHELLSCASESTKQARAFLLHIYTKHHEWEEDILNMLKSPRGAEREMAVEVLQKWGIQQYTEPLLLALQAEKTKKIRTLLQSVLAVEENTEDKDAAPTTITDRIKEILTGNWKRKLAWLNLETVQKVHKKDNSEASEEYLGALLISYADMKIPGVNKDAQELAAELCENELSSYIKELYNQWLSDGAQAKRKWILYAAAIHGGESIVPVLYTQIQEWPKNSRGAMAAEAVKALALNGTSTALVLVDQISRKFKFRQVKEAAAKALDYAAEQLGISREELEDRIVPTLGFNENMERIFDYGKRQFKVVLTQEFSLEAYDANNKLLKNLPAPGKTDDPILSKEAYDAWKLLKKQLKTVIANQKTRLEQALSTKRRWEVGKWQELFVKNPIMRQFAIGLIWGVYEKPDIEPSDNSTSTEVGLTWGVHEQQKIIATFRYMEDGTFNTADEEEYVLQPTGTIGLVHPLDLSTEQLDVWREQLSDYEIVQPILQIGRPVFRVSKEEEEKTELTRFGGIMLNGLSLASKLVEMGWYKGEVLDGGGYDTFYRYDQNKGVELSFSGCYIAGENTEVIVYEAYFYCPGVLETVGYQRQPVRYKLAQVDPYYFSEVVLQITNATASSTERKPYPECKKRW